MNRPTAADARAQAMLAHEEERIPAARVEYHLAAQDSPSVPAGSSSQGRLTSRHGEKAS